MKSKRSKAKIRQIAEQEGLTVKQVEDIVNAPFRFTAKIMASGDKEKVEFSNIRIFKFGLFIVKEGRKRYFRQHKEIIKENLKKKNEKLNRNKKQPSDNFPGSSYNQGVQEAMEQRPVNEERPST